MPACVYEQLCAFRACLHELNVHSVSLHVNLCVCFHASMFTCVSSQVPCTLYEHLCVHVCVYMGRMYTVPVSPCVLVCCECVACSHLSPPSMNMSYVLHVHLTGM